MNDTELLDALNMKRGGSAATIRAVIFALRDDHIITNGSLVDNEGQFTVNFEARRLKDGDVISFCLDAE